MPAITAVGLRKSYRDKEALRGIDIEVPEGSVVAMLGPNGAGKTSLIEILEGHRRRSGGDVSVLGFDPGDRRDFLRLRELIGVVLQNTVLETTASVRTLLRRQASYYVTPLDIDELITDVGLNDAASRRVGSLSGGTKRRLDIALALVGRPRILFLDEPTTGLDPASRRQIHTQIENACAAGTTVVLTSHDLDEVDRLSHLVTVLAQGRVVASGTPAQVVRDSGAQPCVEFELPAGATTEHLPPQARVLGSRVRIPVTHDGDLGAVERWSEAQGVDIPRATVVQPRLEDAYLTIVEGLEKESARV